LVQVGAIVIPETFIARDPVTYLRQFLLASEQTDVTPADVAYVLKTMARELLPTCPRGRQRCPQLGVFGDWMSHDQLDRSAEGQAALATVAEAMPLHGTEGRDNKWLEERVNHGVSFGALRLELLATARRFGLPETWFASWEKWQKFGWLIAFEVSGRHVLLGARPGAAARQRIANTALDPRHRPTRMTLVIGSDNSLWWRIETEDTTVLMVQVLLGGFRPDDFPTPARWRSPFEPE
jgi:hypothetical protein